MVNQPAKRQRHAAKASASSGTNGAISSSVAARKLASRNRLYAPFRALGLISNDVPFALQTRFGGKDATTPDVNVITCLGDSWAMWEAERMTLLFVSSSLPAPINALVISLSPDAVLAAAGTKVYRFVRGKVDAEYDTVDHIMSRFEDRDGTGNMDESDPDDSSESSEASVNRPHANGLATKTAKDEGTQLSSLIVFGNTIAALASDGRSLFIWSLSSTELVRRIDFPADFVASSLLHPATYLNKILIGSTDGQLTLWNIRTGSLIHSYDAATLRKGAGGSGANASSAIVGLTQSPAVDVIAVGFSEGQVLLHDIRLDESLFSVHVSGGLSSGSVSFRSDGKAHSIAVASNSGNISIFDLDPANAGPATTSSMNRGPKLSYSIQDAHDGPVGSIEFVPGQPLLISSGGDNSYKQWFFESASMPPRLLKSRSGHHQPPHLIRYYGEEGKEILSAGRDRSVRSISVVRDSRSQELSQGQLQKKSNQLSVSVASLKLPPATSLSFSLTRSRDWDDLLSTHQGVQFGHTWSVRDKRLGKTPLAASASKKVIAEARTGLVSACGNFALVGNSEGVVEMYNMQSYMHRRTFDTRPLDPAGPAKAKEFPAGSRKALAALQARTKGSAVTGIATDALNRRVVVSTLDGKLHWFDFSTTELLHRASISASGISSISLHSDSNLLIVISDDLVLRLVDIETRRTVREFVGFRGRILDACFSNDARWIVTTSMDSVIRTFDIPSSRLIDAFRTASIATSITFSPTGDFLATAHVDSVGIYLWANKTQFSPIALQGLDESAEVVGEDDLEGDEEVALPTVQGDVEDAALAKMSEAAGQVGEPELQRTYTSPPQLTDGKAGTGLVTLSTMPRSRWMTLLNLDTIKARNKPKQAPKKDTERAPFFLPQTVQGVDFTFDTSADAETNGMDSAAAVRSSIFSSGGVTMQTEFQRRLSAALDSKDASAYFTYLETLSTTTLDLEIRQLATVEDVVALLRVLGLRLAQHRDFEAVQAILATTLRIHSDILIPQSSSATDGEDEDDELEDVEDNEGDEERRLQLKKLKKTIRSLIRLQVAESGRVNGLLDHCLGTLAFLRNLPMT
ncbi:beta-transducin [Testicularia cyperi]|uniref:Beta-transducin n=1 Tax=Testicularia cyperi TaxID=1882483 RepID=A0A317XKB4_9BASI|nr:beta-transducin [Testicularia cyperi]